MKIAVVGAGLAGLATASFLKRDGHDVTVFDKDTQLKGKEFGMLLQPLAVAVLRQLGVANKVLAAGTRINGVQLQKIEKNKPVMDLRYKDLEPELFGVGIQRPKLFDILLENARNLGVNFVSDCYITEAAVRGAQRKLVRADNHNVDIGSYDLVVDASGFRSSLRQYNEPVHHENYGEGAVCFTCDDDKSLSNSFNDVSSVRYQGKNSLTAIPVGNNRTSFSWTTSIENFDPFNLDAWKKEVLAALPSMKSYLDQIISPDQVTIARYADISLKTYSAERMAFVGDAAHSTSPLLAQGAAMGFVDALALSKALQREPDLQKALNSYSAERKNHIWAQQLCSRVLTNIFSSAASPARFIGDVLIPGAAKFVPGLRKRLTRMLARAETDKNSPLRKKYGI